LLEKRYSLASRDTASLWLEWEEMLKIKTSIPHRIVHYISMIADPADLPNDDQLDEISEAIGTIFRMCDDLSDIVEDFLSSSPSHINGEKVWSIESGRKTLDAEKLTPVMIQTIESVLNIYKELRERLDKMTSRRISSQLVDYVTFSMHSWIGV